MITDDLYGYRDDDLEAVRALIEATLGITLDVHKNPYRGAYYALGCADEEMFVLQRNWEPLDAELMEEAFPAARILLYVHGTTRPRELEPLLTNMIEGAALLRREVVGPAHDQTQAFVEALPHKEIHMVANVQSNPGEMTLLPWTKLVLGVSVAVQLIFGVVGLFFTDLWNGLFWTAPLTAWPKEVAWFAFLNYLATAVAAAFALRQGTWSGARVYFAFSFPYIVMSVIAAIVTAVDPGVPPIMWLYVLLSVLYLPAVAVAWARQSHSVHLK